MTKTHPVNTISKVVLYVDASLVVRPHILIVRTFNQSNKNYTSTYESLKYFRTLNFRIKHYPQVELTRSYFFHEELFLKIFIKTVEVEAKIQTEKPNSDVGII
uniref:Uncharacterized protein n=1 Tax=Rhizophagus irregularis (strain DAOM 181602 / DAOM 197198 / MUCL 43194) TaxID=747089 RepID=U9UK32_RHIID